MLRRQQETSALAQRTRAGRALRTLFEDGLGYSRQLNGHDSCVNALAFSRNDGRWLASAGDDKRVILWDYHQEDMNAPSALFTGHHRNIFCLDFSASNRYIYSGSVDGKILRHDITQLVSSSVSTPISTKPDVVMNVAENTRSLWECATSDSVRGISGHPTNDELFLSACENEKITLHDCRIPNSNLRQAGFMKGSSAFTDAKYVPGLETMFAASDSPGNICLYDTRMSFSSDGEGDGMVLKYISGLSRRSVPHVQLPEVSSICFSPDGKRLAAFFLYYLPTVYNISDPWPVATCNALVQPNGAPIPEGEQSYTNNCTIKHGSLATFDNATYLSAGSDDFRGYIWKIPEIEELKEQREVVSRNDWGAAPRTMIGFTESVAESRYVPVALEKPLARLGGHRSIVNTCLIHPQLPQVATAGIERHITLHSSTATTSESSSFEHTDPSVRRLPEKTRENMRQYLDALLTGPNQTADADANEAQAIAFFDGVLRRSLRRNVFTRTDDDSDSDEEGVDGDGEEDQQQS